MRETVLRTVAEGEVSDEAREDARKILREASLESMAGRMIRHEAAVVEGKPQEIFEATAEDAVATCKHIRVMRPRTLAIMLPRAAEHYEAIHQGES